jgi:cation diffusion facilitator family transporter
MNENNYYKKVRNILIFILFLNLAVSVIKLAYGWYTNSLSIVSDGFHSMFDGVSNIVGIVGIMIAARPPDSEHPYGHGKFETLASLGIAVLLFFTCFEIFQSAINRLFNPSAPDITTVSFLVMGITIAINIWVSWYENRQGKKLGSTILIADSLHTRSDIYSSIAVIFGFIMIKLGYVMADPIIAILIALLIARTGIKIIVSSSEILMDKAPLDIESIRKIVNSIDNVKDCHKIRTRGPDSSIYVDLHIVLESCITLDEAHDIAHIVEDKLKTSITGIKDVTVHVDPCK